MGVKNAFLGTQKRLDKIEHTTQRIDREIKNTTIFIKEQQESISTLTQEIKSLHQTQANLTLSFKDTLTQLNGITTELAVFKPTLERTILEKTTTTLERELANATNKLYADMSGFSQAKETFKEIVSQVKQVQKELHHFSNVISDFKNQDFELEQYARELDKNDKQKLELMKRVDELEKILKEIQ
ncbi:MAG: hypothetical protein ACOCQQ_03000 [Candidatus Nanoarchaeia archaeon]